MIDGQIEGSRTESRVYHETLEESKKGDRCRVTIDMLPELALLEIFDFYNHEASIMAWRTLVHVCRQWRNIIFGAPRRLNLRLPCGPKTRVREMLDTWPPLPISMRSNNLDAWSPDNLNAALKLNDRICQLSLTNIRMFPSGRFVAAIRKPFPELRSLHLAFPNGMGPVDLDSFLGGSAPRLKSLSLYRLSVPGLPKLLLSTTHLVHLNLSGIPDSGYISPEAMLVAISALAKLESLAIEFKSSHRLPHPKSRRPSPQTRIFLPVLTRWRFKGAPEYLEVFVSQMDAPLLDKLTIIFFPQPIFDAPELIQFISRTPKFKTHKEAHVTLDYCGISATLPQRFGGKLELGVACELSAWNLSSLAQVCRSSLPRAFIPAVERLHILDNVMWDLVSIVVENNQWLDFFHPFTAVKELYLSLRSEKNGARAVQELVRVGESVTEVLPALQTLFIEETHSSGPVQESIQQFVTARNLTGYPIAVSRWERGINN